MYKSIKNTFLTQKKDIKFIKPKKIGQLFKINNKTSRPAHKEAFACAI